MVSDDCKFFHLFKQEMSKRKRPDSTAPAHGLTEHEKTIYDLIKSKQDMGIFSQDIKRETKLLPNIVTKSLKSLLAKNMIKEVQNVQHKARKHYMASDFEPSAEITGGSWYHEGALDKTFIDLVRKTCLSYISSLKIATVEMIYDAIKRSKLFHVECSQEQIAEILRTLELDNQIVEFRSTGCGEFAAIPIRRVCYKIAKKPGPGKEPKVSPMASIPCGICPRISYCSPDGPCTSPLMRSTRAL
ncbi:hypothetical protein SAY86_001821 [Trapa natans]|uniref:DNA-directed RNA polymerase III subunit RPC6 n=1 Tax=Trapa natans TaxID=22666 RepID=A0AAN7QZU7_TRANT|nr:hypothetical protein SAY86_001821 [Trapa natans]